MKYMKQTIVILMVASLFLSSCGSKGKSEAEITFNEWAQQNVPSRYKINAITYDTIGSIMDIIYTDYVLMESKGGSAKAMNLFNNGSLQFVADYIVDTSLLTTNIVVAKVSVGLPDGNKDYYIGMYMDSVVTQPFSSGMQALGAMPQKSLCLFIESLNVMFTNISEFMPTTQFSVDELSYNMLTDPEKPKAPASFYYAFIESFCSTIGNTKRSM